MQRESELAHIDYLTGAINMRFFYELAGIEIDRFQRYGHPFTLCYIDLDDFKTVNDKFGHATGDLVLSIVADSIKKQIRKTDIFARLGGDEFALLLPETSADAARVAISKIRVEFLKQMQQSNWPVTFSMGVLTCNLHPVSVEELVRQADEVMYQSKDSGKNIIKYSAYKKNSPIEDG